MIPISDSTLCINLFQQLGIPIHHVATSRTREAILYGLEDENNLQRITRNMYVVVAERQNILPSNVERAIRSCVKRMKESNLAFYKAMFPDEIYKGTITNKAFIHVVVRYIENFKANYPQIS